jgi:fructose-bisphosphate aldolase class II
MGENTMPLVNLQYVLKKAESGHYAVGSFDVFNIDMLKGVIGAAEETRSPVILAYIQGFEDVIEIESFAPVMVRMAQKASVPVVVHLDHASSIDYITRAVNCGFTSVMIDASIMPYEDNVAITKRVIQLCSRFNASVEAELGHVNGGELVDKEDEYIYTDVNEAECFVKDTGVDALAVAIGTIHGVYRSKPVLSLQRLKEIKECTRIPIVLHGGSGLSDDDFRNTIMNGVSKINIFTDLAMAAMDCVRQNKNVDLSYINHCAKIVEAVKDETIKKILLFGSDGKAE